VPACLPPRRAAVRPRVEVPHCLVVVADRLLLHDHAALGQPRVRRPGLAELPTARSEPGHRAAAGAVPGFLLDAQVPYVPGMRAMPEQDCFLRRGRIEPVPGHKITVVAGSDISAPEGRDQRCLPGMKARASTPQLR